MKGSSSSRTKRSPWVSESSFTFSDGFGTLKLDQHGSSSDSEKKKHVGPRISKMTHISSGQRVHHEVQIEGQDGWTAPFQSRSNATDGPLSNVTAEVIGFVPDLTLGNTCVCDGSTRLVLTGSSTLDSLRNRRPWNRNFLPSVSSHRHTATHHSLGI